MRRKILVIRFSSIGDIVLTTPVIRALYTQLDAEVHVLTKEAFAPIALANPYVARVLTLGKDFNLMMQALRDQHYDHIIDLHHNLRTLRIRTALGRNFSTFKKLNFQKWLLTRFGVDRLPRVHIVDRYMAAAASLGINPDGRGLDFFIPEAQHWDVHQAWNIQPESYVSIVVGAAHETKCLTATQLARVCDHLDTPVILLGGRQEQEKAEKILKATSNQNVINTCGQLNLMQSASILFQSGPVITHDTGLMHIAAALQKPQVVVWGNTIPAFGMYPYYGASDTEWISVEQVGLNCRPCSKIGYDKCPRGHFKCILNHDPAHIAASANSLFH